MLFLQDTGIQLVKCKAFKRRQWLAMKMSFFLQMMIQLVFACVSPLARKLLAYWGFWWCPNNACLCNILLLWILLFNLFNYIFFFVFFDCLSCTLFFFYYAWTINYATKYWIFILHVFLLSHLFVDPTWRWKRKYLYQNY